MRGPLLGASEGAAPPNAPRVSAVLRPPLNCAHQGTFHRRQNLAFKAILEPEIQAQRAFVQSKAAARIDATVRDPNPGIQRGLHRLSINATGAQNNNRYRR